MSGVFDGLHYAAPPQQIVDTQLLQQALHTTLDQLRQQIAGKQDHDRAEQCRHDLAERREAVLQSRQKVHVDRREVWAATARRSPERKLAPAPVPNEARALVAHRLNMRISAASFERDFKGLAASRG